MRVFLLLLLFLHVSMKQFLFERCIVCCCVAISTLEVDTMFVVCKLQIFIELYFCYVSLTSQSG